jgi:hypothetical protein
VKKRDFRITTEPERALEVYKIPAFSEKHPYHSRVPYGRSNGYRVKDWNV